MMYNKLDYIFDIFKNCKQQFSIGIFITPKNYYLCVDKFQQLFLQCSTSKMLSRCDYERFSIINEETGSKLEVINYRNQNIRGRIFHICAFENDFDRKVIETVFYPSSIYLFAPISFSEEELKLEED